MSLQERTLVVKNFDPEKTTFGLLKELCLQAGPVRNVVMRPDHAFVEFEDVESVGYSKALLDGVFLFGRRLIMEPKLRDPSYRKYSDILHDYIKYDKQVQEQNRQTQHMMYLNQQAQLAAAQNPLLPNPNLQIPINYYQNFNSQIPQSNVFVPQTHFVSPDPASSSVPTYNHSNQLGRSRSFNHQQSTKNRNRSARASDRRWR